MGVEYVVDGDRAGALAFGCRGAKVRCAEEVLRRAAPSGYYLRHREHLRFSDDWDFGEKSEERMAEDLFAPLFWRLPVEAALKSMEPRHYPGEISSLAGYRLLAHELM